MKNLILSLQIVVIGGFAHASGPKLDSSCSVKEFQTLKLKQNCLLKPGYDDSCLMGTIVGSMQGDPLAAANLTILTSSLMRDIRVKLDKVLNQVGEAEHTGKTAAISKGLREIIAKSEDKPGSWDKAISEDKRRGTVRLAIREQFPEELKILDRLNEVYEKEISDARRAYEAKYGRYDYQYSSWDPNYRKQGQQKLEAEIRSRYLEAKNKAIRNNPRLRLVGQLMAGADYIRQTIQSAEVAEALKAIAKDDKLKNAKARRFKKVQFIDDRYPFAGENKIASGAGGSTFLSRFGKVGAAGAGGAALAATGLFGSSVVEKIRDRTRLNKCQEYFGLSNEEMNYLKDGSFYSLRVKTSEKCIDFGFLSEDPMLEFTEILKKFDGVPVGICKMVKAQIEKLKELNPDVKISKSSCVNGDISGEGFKVLVSDKRKRIIRMRVKNGEEYSFPWDDSTLFPDFLVGGEFDTSDPSRIKRQQSLSDYALKRITKYGDGGGGQYVFTSEDDLLSPCEDSIFCEVRQIASMARTAVIQQSMICELNSSRSAKSARPTSDASR